MKAKPTLKQLLNARRPLLSSRMPRMLGDDGLMADSLQHEFYYVGNIKVPWVAVSARRWKAAVRTSRILRGQRELHTASSSRTP